MTMSLTPTWAASWRFRSVNGVTIMESFTRAYRIGLPLLTGQSQLFLLDFLAVEPRTIRPLSLEKSSAITDCGAIMHGKTSVLRRRPGQPVESQSRQHWSRPGQTNSRDHWRIR